MTAEVEPPGPVGVAVIDKAAGLTSHDVVARARRVLGTRKVGHSGTLDPGATGVLILGVGRATRLLRFLTALPKRYEGELVLGVETNTLDHEGEVTATHDMEVTLDQVSAAAAAFVGDIEQVPPMVSAIKIDGTPLHKLAREGKEVERKPRPVTIHDLTVSPTDDPLVFVLDVKCSSGTYIRTLAADIGSALGGGAHLRDLRRTAIGSFDLDQAHQVEEPVLITPGEALRDYERVTLDDDAAQSVRFGRPLPQEIVAENGPGPWRVYDAGGTMLAVYERVAERQPEPLIRAAVVLEPA